DGPAGALAARTLRTVALRPVAPEVARRLGQRAAAPDEAFAVTPAGDVLWGGSLAGRISGGDPFAPRVRLLGELGPAPARERAQRRLEAFVAAEAGRALRDLRRLRTATESGSLTGLPRGLAFRLVEAGGVLDRRDVARDLAALSQAERRTLKTFAIRVGAHSVWLPGVLKPRARALAQAFTPVPGLGAVPGLQRLPDPPPSPRALAARGLRAVAGYAVPVEALERFAELSREAGKAHTPEAALAGLGWTEAEAMALRTGLRIPRARDPERALRPRLPADSPFAALAALTAPPPPARRKHPRRRRTVATAATS
ncbi:MAG: phosphonate-binding protein, partial [Brevundimonas sp.]